MTAALTGNEDRSKNFVLRSLSTGTDKEQFEMTSGLLSRLSPFVSGGCRPILYEGFGSLLNKSRSANIGVVFSHQSMGDIDRVSQAFRNVLLSKTNVKCVMRTIEPETCEYFARTFGTKESEKLTNRQHKRMLGHQNTGDGSTAPQSLSEKIIGVP